MGLHPVAIYDGFAGANPIAIYDGFAWVNPIAIQGKTSVNSDCDADRVLLLKCREIFTAELPREKTR